MNNPSQPTRLPIDVDLDEASNYILCPGELERGGRCNAKVYINRRKPKDNPLACPECGQPLRIMDADGETELNEHWRLIDGDTPLALIIADKFKLTGFGSRQIADKWRRFERDLNKPGSLITPERVMAAMDECYTKRGEGFGPACWAWIMARCANKIARESVTPPRGEVHRKRLVAE